MNRENNNNRNNTNRRMFNFGPRQGNHIENAKVYIDSNSALKRQIRVAFSVTAIKAIVHVLNSNVEGNDDGFLYLMSDVTTLRDWVLTAEKNVPSSSKKIDINYSGTNHCAVMMNENVVKYLNMGFEVKAIDGPVFKSQMTTKMVETAVSLLSQKNGVYEPAINTKKFYPPLAMTETPALKLATAIDESGLTLRSEIISNLVDQVHNEDEAADLIASMAPPMFAPEVILDSRSSLQLFPSSKAVPVLDEAYIDPFLKSINTLTKKAVYSEVANGHMVGHYFGVDDKYVKFLADFRSFGIEGDVVVHTADQQYAIALANHFETIYNKDDRPEITIIGANVKKEARYNTTFSSRINRVGGTHIIPTCTAPQSEERTSIFDSSIEHDTQVRNDLEGIGGNIYRKIKVFALVDGGSYLPSTTMGSMECWEFIVTGRNAVTYVDDDVSDAAESRDEAAPATDQVAPATNEVVEQTQADNNSQDAHNDNDPDDSDFADAEGDEDPRCWTKEDIRQEIAYYVMHWYIYPWIRIPLRTLKRDCIDMSGTYDLRMKRVDVIGYCSNSETDETVREFLSNISEYDEEIVEVAIRHRGRFASASARRSVPASSFDNDGSTSASATKSAPVEQKSAPVEKMRFQVADSDEEDEEDADPTGQSVWKNQNMNSRVRPAVRKVAARRVREK